MDIEIRSFKKDESWGLIANNIAMKDGDYPGDRNVTRMRTCITSQHEFLKTQSSEHK